MVIYRGCWIRGIKEQMLQMCGFFFWFKDTFWCDELTWSNIIRNKPNIPYWHNFILDERGNDVVKLDSNWANTWHMYSDNICTVETTSICHHKKNKRIVHLPWATNTILHTRAWACMQKCTTLHAHSVDCCIGFVYSQRKCIIHR